MIQKQCLYCKVSFTDEKGNRNYCSSRCYYSAKNERSKAHQRKLKLDLRESKIQQNDMICDMLVAKGLQSYQTNFNEVDALGFDFNFYRSVTKDEQGYALKFVNYQIRLIDPFQFEIERI